MKTQDYVKKYQLNIDDKFNHSEFVSDLANDFVVLLGLNKAEDNIKGFENALRAIRMKFDAINNKTVGQLTDKLWNFFFATVVVKLREELCPKDMEKRRLINEQKKKDWEQRKKEQAWVEEQFTNMFNKQRESFFNGFLSSLFKRQSAPSESFLQLGFENDNVSIDEINSSYKKLVLKHHPDKGGKQEDFISITESKNKCIQWLNSKT